MLTDNVTKAVNFQLFQHLSFEMERYCPENESESEVWRGLAYMNRVSQIGQVCDTCPKEAGRVLQGSSLFLLKSNEMEILGGTAGSYSVPTEICVKSRLGLWTKCSAKERRLNRQNSAPAWWRPLKRH